MADADVGIIGAGIHGASAAYHLAKGGAEVVVFDSWAAASGPTGRSSAICRAYYTNDFLAEVAKDSLEIFRNFTEITHGRSAGFRQTGMLFLHPESDVEQVSAACTRLNQIGTTVEALDVLGLGREFPAVNPDGIAIGVWEPGAGYADPVGTTVGLLDRALELGAKAQLYTPVVTIRQSDAGVELTTADGKQHNYSAALIAAGPWSKQFAAQLGVDLPLTVERHFVVTIEWQDASRMPYSHADVIGTYYCKPEGLNLYCIGSLAAESESDPDRYSAILQDGEGLHLIRRLTHRIRGIGEAKSTGGWASLYDVSPDWQPVIGQIAESVFIDAGTSGHGFKLAPALGKVVADMVTGSSDPRLEQFHPSRFKENRPLPAGYGVSSRILG